MKYKKCIIVVLIESWPGDKQKVSNKNKILAVSRGNAESSSRWVEKETFCFVRNTNARDTKGKVGQKEMKELRKKRDISSLQ